MGPPRSSLLWWWLSGFGSAFPRCGVVLGNWVWVRSCGHESTLLTVFGPFELVSAACVSLERCAQLLMASIICGGIDFTWANGKTSCPSLTTSTCLKKQVCTPESRPRHHTVTSIIIIIIIIRLLGVRVSQQLEKIEHQGEPIATRKRHSLKDCASLNGFTTKSVANSLICKIATCSHSQGTQLVFVTTFDLQDQ